MIPERERGYSVEADTATVHERYQDHAPRAMRVRSIEGVYNVTRGREPVLCPTCFPAPKAKAASVKASTQPRIADPYMAEREVPTDKLTVRNAPTETFDEEQRKP